MNIGVFDSGLGGLTIFRELLKKLPDYNYIYLGDNARVPYGNRSPEIIYKFTRQAVDFLFKKNCSLVIIACNTSTAAALRKLQKEYLPKHYPDKRVLGVIKPTVEVATELKVKRVGVIGTRATVNSGSFVRELKKENPKVQVFQKAGPLLVPFIEEGEVEGPILESVLGRYIIPLIEEKIDSLILGCTHYGLIKFAIKKVVGPKIKVISEAEIVAKKLKEYLKKHPEIEKILEKDKKRQFFVTDYSLRYENLVQLFLGKHFKNHHKLELVSLS